tara:strand:- start:57 stop:509 length:453 start_codon:yes stop_codon:yes gene_type:complete
MQLRKLLSIIFISFLSIGNVYAEETDVYYCKLKNPYEVSKDKYEYTIIWYKEQLHNLILQDDKTKELVLSEIIKTKASIKVKKGEEEYSYSGFKNNMSNLEHYFVFIDGANIIYAYVEASEFKNTQPSKWVITSFDNAFDKVTKGTCKKL